MKLVAQYQVGMRASERMDLLEKVGSELQSRYTYADIDAFFAALDISTINVDSTNTNSKRVYAKAVLSRVTEAVLLQVASELDIIPHTPIVAPIGLPKNWEGTKDFRLFISHISKHKARATKLKQALARYGISGFVAHEDIQPTLSWQDEIERALQTMDALVAVRTPGFSASIWTQQEIGYALGRGAMVISFKMGEDPTGFIGKHQALPHRDRSAEEIAEEIDKLLAADPRTEARLLEAKASA